MDPDGRTDIFAPRYETIYIPKDFQIETTIIAKDLKDEWNIFYDLNNEASKIYYPLDNLFEKKFKKITDLVFNGDISTATSKLSTFIELMVPNQDEINFDEFEAFYRNIDTRSEDKILKTISVTTTVKDKDCGGANLQGKVITTKTKITYINQKTGEKAELNYTNVKNILTSEWNKYFVIETLGD